MVNSWARILILASCATTPAALRAQPPDHDFGEVSAFTGGNFGVGSHWTVGGATGLSFSRYGMVLFEGSYTPMGNDTVRSHPAGYSVQSSRLMDLNLTFHITIPVRERLVPYVILGGGPLWVSYDQAVAGSQGAALTHVNEWNFGFHTGGGVRYYIRDNWGVRPEFKVIVSNRIYTRLSVGIFYNLPTGWP